MKALKSAQPKIQKKSSFKRGGKNGTDRANLNQLFYQFLALTEGGKNQQ